MNAWPIEQNRLRAEIVRVGASLFQRGYVHSSAGNISVRLDDAQGGGFLITPTDACLGFLEPAQLAWIDAAGVQRGGARASKTMALLEELEETARLWLLCAPAPTPLSEAQIAELRAHFNAPW